jgi:hypothetical protein
MVLRTGYFRGSASQTEHLFLYYLEMIQLGTYGGIGPKYSTMMVNGLPVDAFVDPMTLI